MGEERVGNRDVGGHKKKRRQASDVVGGGGKMYLIGMRRNLRKKEVLKTEGKWKGEVRVQKKREASPQGAREAGDHRKEKSSSCTRRWGLQEKRLGPVGERASLSTAPNSEDWWPLPDLQGRE